jgi:hypothetical protein
MEPIWRLPGGGLCRQKLLGQHGQHVPENLRHQRQPQPHVHRAIAGPQAFIGPQDLFPQIVNMQALYGKDTDGDGIVDTYDETTPTTPAGWRQVLTIRVAIVARSIKDEGSNVTTSQPLWDIGAQRHGHRPDDQHLSRR